MIESKEKLKTALVEAWNEFFQEGLALGVSRGFNERHMRTLSINYASKELERTCRQITGEHADAVFFGNDAQEE